MGMQVTVAAMELTAGNVTSDQSYKVQGGRLWVADTKMLLLLLLQESRV